LKQGIQEEMARVDREGFTWEKLNDAKTGMLQARRLERTQDAALAGRRMAASGFDFQVLHDIEFFAIFPTEEEALTAGGLAGMKIATREVPAVPLPATRL
jgi:hypothetical protein